MPAGIPVKIKAATVIAVPAPASVFIMPVTNPISTKVIVFNSIY